MDYQNGKIYIIRNHVDDKVYIGSTTQSLAKRMSKHKQDLNAIQTRNRLIFQKFKEYGFEKFYIELLELYPCSSKDELTAREGHWIRHYNSFNNGLNMAVCGRTHLEYKQEYKERNRERDCEKIACPECQRPVRRAGMAEHRRTEIHKILSHNKDE